MSDRTVSAYCNLCRLGQGIDLDLAADWQKELFDRFVDAHRGCAADAATVERVRVTVPKKSTSP